MQAEERSDEEDDATPQTEDEGADSAEDARSQSEEDAGDDDGDATDSSDSDSGESDDAGDDNAEGIAAPSIGPDTEIEREPPEERLARHEQSTVDAMGNDKRRAVTDQAYGASKSRRLILYGAFVVVIVALFFGARLAVSEFDKPRDREDKDPAAWADEKGGEEVQPAPLDFPRNGKQDIEQPDSDLGDAKNSEESAGAQEPDPDASGTPSSEGSSS